MVLSILLINTLFKWGDSLYPEIGINIKLKFSFTNWLVGCSVKANCQHVWHGAAMGEVPSEGGLSKGF